jgi:hypothetical protein
MSFLQRDLQHQHGRCRPENHEFSAGKRDERVRQTNSPLSFCFSHLKINIALCVLLLLLLLFIE